MNTVEILDRLIGVCVDGAALYRRAAKDVGRANLETLFKRKAADRKHQADELQAARVSLGIVEKESGTLRGLIDRRALDFDVIMSKGDTGVAEWCRQDDEAVIGEYEKALAEPLAAELRRLISRQLCEIRGAVEDLENFLSVFGHPRS